MNRKSFMYSEDELYLMECFLVELVKPDRFSSRCVAVAVEFEGTVKDIFEFIYEEQSRKALELIVGLDKSEASAVVDIFDVAERLQEFQKVEHCLEREILPRVSNWFEYGELVSVVLFDLPVGVAFLKGEGRFECDLEGIVLTKVDNNLVVEIWKIDEITNEPKELLCTVFGEELSQFDELRDFCRYIQEKI